MLLNDCS